MAISQNFPSIAPSLSLNFASSRTLDPRITFTRTSSATCVGPNGLLRVVPANASRFDHNPVTGESLGLLVEEQRTNSIRNNTMVGAVAGTPGTLPTNWVVSAALAGLTTNVIGTGTTNGITWIDVQVVGTASATLYQLSFDSNTAIAASASQAWTGSFWVAQVAGTTSNITATNVRVSARDSGGSTIGVSDSSAITLSSTLTRYSSAYASLPASSAFIQESLRLALTNGVAIDITLRIGLPQLEQGAFATSVIPTTTSTVTRTADVASITGSNFSSWYRQDEGTMFAQAERSSPNSSSFSVFAVGENPSNFITTQFLSSVLAGGSGSWGSRIRASGDTPFANIVSSPAVTTTTAKTVLSKDGTAYALSVNGGPISTFGPSGNTPSTTEARIGTPFTQSTPTGAGWIQRLAYWPQRLPNSILQTLTK
jgi:hypothetical protein